MSNIFPYISFYENKPCDVCYYAEQYKLSFTHNSTRTKNIFDMIHVDIWGPFGTASMHGHKFFLTIVDDHSSDGDQVEEESEAQAQEPQGRIIRSKAKVLGKEHQMLSLFVITFV